MNAEKYHLKRFKIRHKQGLYIILKEGIYFFSLSSQLFTNSLFEAGSHFAEKCSLTDLPFFKLEKTSRHFLTHPFVISSLLSLRTYLKLFSYSMTKDILLLNLLAAFFFKKVLQISFKYVPFCQLVCENRSQIKPKQSTIEANR